MGTQYSHEPDGSLNGADDRFTFGLAADVHKVLEAHGYRLPVDKAREHYALGAMLPALLRLTRVFEGGAP